MGFRGETRAKVGSGDNLFLKLKDRESIKGIIRGEPFKFFSKWKNGKSSPSEEGDPEAKFRFRVNILINENGNYIARIWEQGAISFNSLVDLAEHYDLNETILTITRNGSGTDTTYSIIPLPNKLDVESLRKIRAVQLNELAPKVKPDSHPDFGNAPSDFNDEVIPF